MEPQTGATALPMPGVPAAPEGCFRRWGSTNSRARPRQGGTGVPNCFIGPFDDLPRKKPAASTTDLPIKGDDDPIDVDSFELPRSGIRAAIRGASNHCPSYGSKPLFARYLKPIARCEVCSQDWTPQQADDFPAYVSILITGHVLAPIIIALASQWDVPTWLLMGLILALAAGMMIALLQPAKGAIIAMQWWLGMQGFVKPEPPEITSRPAADRVQ